ncbi:unnamed protein product [Trichogramma brassicae]|uniref:Uncharacterized protein n=1 Tax=Trichogramma brassicae TaxID=86971 RepID=A0A6H5ITQ0_9HYME|nr:unnamed protein product [Trichogramma brassicae]
MSYRKYEDDPSSITPRTTRYNKRAKINYDSSDEELWQICRSITMSTKSELLLKKHVSLHHEDSSVLRPVEKNCVDIHVDHPRRFHVDHTGIPRGSDMDQIQSPPHDRSTWNPCMTHVESLYDRRGLLILVDFHVDIHAIIFNWEILKSFQWTFWLHVALGHYSYFDPYQKLIGAPLLDWLLVSEQWVRSNPHLPYKKATSNPFSSKMASNQANKTPTLSNNQNKPTNKPTYSQMNQHFRYPTREEAIVLDSISGISIHSYTLAIGSIIQPKNVIFVSRISTNRVCLYLSDKSHILELSAKAVEVEGHRLIVQPLISQAKRILREKEKNENPTYALLSHSKCYTTN